MKAMNAQDHGLEIVSASAQEIARLVVQAAEASEPPPRSIERRRESRRPYPNVISVTPLIDGTYRPAGGTYWMIGRHLGNLGVDFFHDCLIPEKRAIIGLQIASDAWAHFVIELGWSRFIQAGWYISGGRFTHVIDRKHPTSTPGCESPLTLTDATGSLESPPCQFGHTNVCPDSTQV